MVFPWRYRMPQSIARHAVPSQLIDIGAVDSQVSLSCLARLDFSWPVTRDCRKDDNEDEEMAGERAVHQNLAIAMTSIGFPKF